LYVTVARNNNNNNNNNNTVIINNNNNIVIIIIQPSIKKTKIAVEILSRKGHKYEVNLR